MAKYPTVVVRGEVLASWLTVSDYTRSRLAAELAVSKGRVSQLLRSGQEPSAHLIAKLIFVTRLPFDRIFKIVREAPAVAPGTGHANGNGDRRFLKNRRLAADRRARLLRRLKARTQRDRRTKSKGRRVRG